VSARTPARAVLALVGPRCSGKTSVGRALAGRSARPFVDQDAELLRFGIHSGWRVHSVGELLTQAGQARFRDLEAAVLRRVLEPGLRVVLATGGGVVEREDNRAWLARAAFTVYLEVPEELLRRRMAAQPGERPALLGTDPVAEVGELLARRAPLYRAVADLVLDCGDAAPEELAGRLAAELAL